MLEIILYVLIALTVIVVCALIFPVKFFLHASGGTEKGYEISGRIMMFSGLVGGGLMYHGDIYRLQFFISSKRLLSVNIQPAVKYVSGKAKERREKKVKPLKKKAPLIERITAYYHESATYWEYGKMGLSDIREILRIDLFSTHVTLGLGNPALTGKIVGIIYAVNNILPRPFEITPSWDFSRRTLQGELTVTIVLFSHKFWKKVVQRFPMIIAVIQKMRGRKYQSHDLIVLQEV